MTWRCLPVIMVALAGFGCGPKPETAATKVAVEPAVTITVATVQARTVARSVAAVGTLNGFDEATLSPKVSGRILHVAVDVGDPVYPGQVLLEIDPTDARKDVERALRSLALELARLDLPELVPQSQFKTEDVPAVRKAQFTLDNVVRERDRVKSLAGPSDQERQRAETEVKVAEATRNLAVAEAKAGLTTAWVRKDEADAAELRRDDCTLRAPVPAAWSAWAATLGPAAVPLRFVVAQRFVTEGEMVQSMPITNAFRLVLNFALKLRVMIPERYSSEVKIGRPADVRVEAYPNEIFRGTVARVNPTVDSLNRTFQVEVAVPNLDGRLKAGGFARAEVLTRTDAGVLSVPPTAVVSFAGVNKVFVIVNGSAKAVEVKVGTREREWTEVIGDLTPGTMVATSGFAQLVDGSAVKLRE